MIDPATPDYTNTPASARRPARVYAPARDGGEPLVSIITPYYNTGPVFWETVRAVQRMSLPAWEWLIVDDGGDDPASLAQLEQARAQEPRIRVLRQANGGPAVARNRAAREARGRYLLLLDGDDLVEPTFVEKAVWFLETQPSSFAAVNAYNVTFGAKNLLWPHGFDHGAENLRENFCTIQSVIRTADFLAVGGFDEAIRHGHEDWDFWLTLADHGLWGYTIPEFLTWYRRGEGTRINETTDDWKKSAAFHRFLRDKHRGLERHFPRLKPLPAGYTPPPERHAAIPIANPLAKPDGVRRVLLIAPWLQVGGADRFNLDMIKQLTSQGYEFTVVTTLRDEHPWLSEFTRITPDVFCLHTFLNLADHPRFISYLIESRQIDAALVSNSEFGYALLPYLRARHPDVALLDYTHSEEPAAPFEGYPGLSVNCGASLDTRVTNTEYLRNWMIARGADSDTIEVCRCAVDTEIWNPELYDRDAIRREMGVGRDTPVLLYVGRMSPEKRPLMFGRIVQRLHSSGHIFQALAIGSGPELDSLREFVRHHNLAGRLRLTGPMKPEDIRRVMAGSDILLLPSEREGLAIVLMEAMAMGMVPVAADIGGQRELVDEDVGYLVPPNSEELDAYVNIVAGLLDHPERRKALAARVRCRVTGDFDMRHLSERMSAAFQVALTRARETSTEKNKSEYENAAHIAAEIIARLAPQDAIDAAWHATQHDPVRGRIRLWRQRLLPQGTGRYERYRQLRQALRSLSS